MKKLLITLLLVAAIVVLILSVPPPRTIQTTPVIQEIPRGQPTPRFEVQPSTPTPKAPEVIPPPPGINAEDIFPQEINFWVNNIIVREITPSGGFIRIGDNELKTFAGSFGRYEDDPTANLKVLLCAEFTKFEGAGACEQVPIIYRSKYVSFAKGYQFDEYIGGLAAKDYYAYYEIYVKDTKVGVSNKAVIRTVKD